MFIAGAMGSAVLLADPGFGFEKEKGTLQTRCKTDREEWRARPELNRRPPA